MAKIYGLFGAMSGKLSDTVMSVRNGEQIVRKYQPIVANPKSEAQTAIRARLKLMSQLSAVMAPVIAIRREGPVSSRNLFSKYNFPATSFAEGAATVTLTAIKITRSVVNLPAVNAVRESATLTLSLAQGVTDLNRVVYAAFSKQADGTLRYAGSTVVTDGGDDGRFVGVLVVGTTAAVVYAYGIRDNTEAARVAFGNLQVLTAETVAKIIVTRTLIETDVTLTETQALEVPVS